mmetsp:Transcript_14546/g.54972  ORF Transcript_14546/g.54972 Transcript_14546/m.54972 type:complete len:215 (+) Transcript_14546:1008-1652(+)
MECVMHRLSSPMLAGLIRPPACPHRTGRLPPREDALEDARLLLLLDATKAFLQLGAHARAQISRQVHLDEVFHVVLQRVQIQETNEGSPAYTAKEYVVVAAIHHRKRGEGRGLERFDNAPQGRLPRQQDQVRVHHVPSCKLERAISFQGREILHALRFHFHVVERIPRVDRDAEGNDHGDEDGDLILEGARELQRNHSSRDGMRHGGCKCGPAA